MTDEKTCFVISPIGKKDTEPRAHADLLLDYIIEPALEKYRFTVVRVDRLSHVTEITDDIVTLIQEAELCVIILTGHNANVLYEAGRRHETGKPFIQLIKEGEGLPFDLAGIRSIMYDDIESTTSSRHLIREIQDYVDVFEQTGWKVSRPNIDLNTIATILDRIERKLSKVPGDVPAMPLSGIRPTGGNPRENFLVAIAQNDIPAATSTFSILRNIISGAELVAAAALLAERGGEVGFRVVEEALFEDDTVREDENFPHFVGVYVQFLAMTDREREGLAKFEALLNDVIKPETWETENHASFLNQYQRLLYGAGQYERALSISEQVIQLVPDDASYLFNASIICHQLNLSERAIKLAETYLELDPDDDHLVHAIELYVEDEQIEKARELYSKLAAEYPQKAMIIAMRNDLRRIL